MLAVNYRSINYWLYSLSDLWAVDESKVLTLFPHHTSLRKLSKSDVRNLFFTGKSIHFVKVVRHSFLLGAANKRRTVENVVGDGEVAVPWRARLSRDVPGMLESACLPDASATPPTRNESVRWRFLSAQVPPRILRVCTATLDWFSAELVSGRSVSNVSARP